MRTFALLIVAVGVAGCGRQAANPSFPLTEQQARADLLAMSLEKHRPTLARPVVIVGGYGDPGFAVAAVRDALAKVIDDDRILTPPVRADDFDEARRQLVAAVNERFPSPEPGVTVEVDVVGNSMGGLVAMYAADPGRPLPHLRIRRLMTISTPFRGANMARDFPIGPMAKAMQPGSAFLANLYRPDAAPAYKLTPYCRLGDEWGRRRQHRPAGPVAVLGAQSPPGDGAPDGV